MLLKVLTNQQLFRGHVNELHQRAWKRQARNKMAANETEEIDVTKEFNLLPVVFETIQALQKTSDPQELIKKVFL